MLILKLAIFPVYVLYKYVEFFLKQGALQMAKLSNFATNLDAAKNGVTKDIGNGVKVTIARAGESNPNYQRVMRQLMKPHERVLNSNDEAAKDEIFADILNRAYAETILLGWSDLEDDNGPIPYSKDKAYEILSDKQYAELFRKPVMDLAGDALNFAKEVKEQVEKN